jgi:hypothetical protein
MTITHRIVLVFVRIGQGHVIHQHCIMLTMEHPEFCNIIPGALRISDYQQAMSNRLGAQFAQGLDLGHFPPFVFHYFRRPD